MLYQLKMEAHNIAGISEGDFNFVTLTKDGDAPPPDLIHKNLRNIQYLDLKAYIFIIVTISAVICFVSVVIICYKQSKWGIYIKK